MIESTSRAVGKAINAARSVDPLAPVVVRAPSVEAANSLARALGTTGGVANVSFLTGRRHAEALLPPLNRPLRSEMLTSDLARELTRVVASGARPPLGTHASPVLVAELSKAFRRLRDLSEIDREALAGAGELQTEICRLFDLYRGLVGDLADERALHVLATMFVDDTAPFVVAVTTGHEKPHEMALLNVLQNAGRLERVSVDVDVTHVDAHAMTVAPDPQTEVEIAIGKILQRAADGVAFRDMAIVHFGSADYSSLIETQLDVTGVPWRGRSSLTLGQSVPGRVLQGLVGLAAKGLDRDGLVGWLRTGPLRLTADSAVCVPSDVWCGSAVVRRSGNGIEELLGRLAQTAEHVELVRFVDEMKTLLDGLPASWNEWSQWTTRALGRFLGPLDELEHWPEVERACFARICEATSRMARLDDLAPSRHSVDAATFAAALEDELLAARPRRNARNGAYVGTLQEVVGCELDTVIVCGVGEDLSLDARGSGLVAALALPGELDRSRSNHDALLGVVAGSSFAALSFSRSNPAAGRERRPSPWLLEIASAWAAEPVTMSKLFSSDTGLDWLTVLPSFSASLMPTQVLANPQLDRLAALRAGDDGALDARLAKGFEAIRERAASDFGPFDGFAGSLDLQSELRTTALETWATCPYRFFLSEVLRVPTDEEVVDSWSLGALDRGVLVHAVLEEFFKTAEPRNAPNESWSDNDRSLLHEICDRLLAEANADGTAPGGLLCGIESAALHEHLDALLERDVEMRSQAGVVPAREGVEIAFGDRRELASLQLERADRVPVRLRGRIDRVDVSPNGERVRVIDYKTGSGAKYGDLEDPVDSGKRLQLAAYAAAAAQGRPGSTEVEALYWFVLDAAGGYPVKQITWSESTRERLVGVIQQMTGGIEGGVFPAVPGEEAQANAYSNCRTCPFDDICPTDREDSWSRKRNDPKVRPFLDLSEHE